LDDVIVIGRTFIEHLFNLRKVFRPLLEAYLKLNPEKYNLLQREVRYRRHIESPEEITMDLEKPKVVPEWPTKKNKHGIRSFLGLCTYYRRLTSGVANIAKTLTTHGGEASLPLDSRGGSRVPNAKGSPVCYLYSCLPSAMREVNP
jgi:hypothetical protein